MIKKHIIAYILFNLATTIGFAQNLIPFDWQLVYNSDTVTEKSTPINLLFSWERQGVSYLKPSGNLQTTFIVPKTKKSRDYVLEITLLAHVESIHINDHYIDGDFSTDFIWSATPEYKSRKFNIPAKYLKFNQENSISIQCDNYAYTGGKNHNAVKFYADSISNSAINIQFETENHLFNNPSEVKFDLDIYANTKGFAEIIIENDYHETSLVKKLPVKKGQQSESINLATENLQAVFYSITAILKDNAYTGATSFFTVSPTEIQAVSNQPDGYSQYWDNALEELKTVAPKFKVERKDELSTEKRDGYIVQMQSIGDVTIYGYYFVPKKKGEFPAIINLPGYGYGFENLDEFLSVQDDVIELALCVRGHGLSAKSFETEFPAPGFFGYEICDVNKIAYRQIFMDCIRAVDFLLTRNEVDQSKIGVMGSSQGGGLTIMTAALAAEHISACAYGDPFPTDLKNHIRIRTLIQDEMNSYLNYYDNKCTFEEGINTFEFFDTKYFAKNIQCQTLYITGLADDDCPPRLGFSAFNDITAPKQFKVFPNDSHIGESNWKKEMMAFFKKQFEF